MTEDDKDGPYHKIEERNNMLHSLGNLTLLTSSLNPAVSNSSFEIKKKEIVKHSTLILNSYFIEIEQWNEAEIEKRSAMLIESILKIWQY
jgi:hypothetical protein